MMAPKTTNNYKCLLFLKDRNDKSLLRPGTCLYGEFIRSTGIFFMSPYTPQSDSFPVIGVIKNSPRYDYEKPFHLVVSHKDQSFIACTVIENKRLQLPVKLIYKSSIYARTPFLASEMNLLWNKTVTIIGLGTGGSKIAVEMAEAGVGHLKLCDPQKLKLRNTSRHEGDLFDIGKYKTRVVAECVYRTNPSVRIETFPEDIFERPLTKVRQILQSDLVVAATDKRSIQLLINHLVHKLQIPCVFGGCYEEARGGEIFFTLPKENMPCMACLRAELEEPVQNHKVDYSTAKGPRDYQGQPGLHSAVNFITCVEVLICLAILLRDSKTSKLARIIDPRFNFILIGGALGAGFYRFKKPFHVFFQPLSGPRKTCPVCQNYDLSDLGEKK